MTRVFPFGLLPAFPLAALVGVPLFALGCATAPQMNADRVYIAPATPPATPAPALVFDPPVTAYLPQSFDPYLDRQARTASAYLGYESSSTVGTVLFADRQYYNDASRGSGRYGSGLSSLGYVDRQAFSQTTVVRQR